LPKADHAPMMALRALSICHAAAARAMRQRANHLFQR